MNTPNSSREIQYPKELDIRITELEKELAPFLNTQNLSFTLKEILASATGPVSKILGVTSCSNVDNIINYIDKYNEYVKLLKERNDFLTGTNENLAYNYELKIQRFKTTIKALEASELNLRKGKLELENKIKILTNEKNELKTERNKIAEVLKRAVAKIKSNLSRYREIITDKNIEITDLKSILKEVDFLATMIKAEKIDDLYEENAKFKITENQSKLFQETVSTLQMEKESLRAQLDNYTKLYVKLLDSVNKLGKISEIDLLEQENQDLLDINSRTINENFAYQNTLSEKDLEIARLKEELNNKNILLESKESESQITKEFLSIMQSLINGNKKIEELKPDEAKLIMDKTSVHPSIAVKAYTHAANNFGHTQAAGLFKHTQQD